MLNNNIFYHFIIEKQKTIILVMQLLIFIDIIATLSVGFSAIITSGIKATI